MAEGSRGLHAEIICPLPKPLIEEVRQSPSVVASPPAAVVAELRALLLKPEHCLASVPKQRPSLLALKRAKPGRPKLNPMVFDAKFLELAASFSTSASQSEDSDSQASV